MQSSLVAGWLSLVSVLALANPNFAQEPGNRAPAAKPQAARAAQKDPADKQETPASAGEEMRQAITQLTAEMISLGSEVQRLRKVTERNAATMELLLNEERLSKMEDRIRDATDRKAQLDAREQDLQRRMRNIPGELIGRGALRREDAEAAVKAELQRALDDVHSQQTSYQQRITDLNADAERLRARVETLRKKVDQVESKNEKQDD
jgi:chromosome segregation ATPase